MRVELVGNGKNCLKLNREVEAINDEIILEGFAYRPSNDISAILSTTNPSQNHILIIYWLVLIFVFILTISFVIFCIKIRNERKKLKELRQLFEKSRKGNLSKIDNDIEIKLQMEHLPYKEEYEFPMERLQKGEALGSGEFGLVFRGIAKGILSNEVETAVAIKQSKLDVDAMKSLLDEIKVMMYLQSEKNQRHLNVVNLLGTITNILNKGELYAIVEYCLHGNLKSFITTNEKGYINQLNDIGEIDPRITVCIKPQTNDDY